MRGPDFRDKWQAVTCPAVVDRRLVQLVVQQGGQLVQLDGQVRHGARGEPVEQYVQLPIADRDVCPATRAAVVSGRRAGLAAVDVPELAAAVLAGACARDAGLVRVVESYLEDPRRASTPRARADDPQ